ncbi:MAG: fructose bisphosphate aldolase [Actinobacteria bacterium]|nr:fructose bisphosphate aldolase [Actinomycetota bacterium]
MTNLNPQMLERMRTGQGFIAALDQSGGSTPKALKLYGIEENEYSGEAAMFDLMHAMRTRMIKSSVFNSNRILAVILFEMTMLRQIDGMGSAEFLWQKKGIVPFLKTDNGLAAEADGVQLMKPVPELADRVALGVSHSVFGTKMRSVIKAANEKGIEANVAQQFEMGKVVLKGGMVPIIEPEVDIKSANKAECEVILKKNILAQLDALSADQKVMLKLTIPTVANFYEDLIKHPKVIRVVALSGGYARDEANALLSKNRGMIASFSRALAEGLSAKQSDAEFDAVFDKSIGSIFDASTKKAS